MDHEVIVIGSGPSGLATAAELTARGVDAVVLERGSGIGAAWAGRYDALRFNTSRRLSALPGASFPREYGQFATRDQYVAYLEDYTVTRDVTVQTGVEVTGLERRGDRWLVGTADGERTARHVVVATGIYHTPELPAWPGAAEFRGRLVHAADYRNPTPYRGQDVLVVGAGSTGMEIAHQLVTGGAKRVRLSVRTPPTILYRTVGGQPIDLPVPLFMHLPTPLVDRLLTTMARRVVGDLTAYGLAQPQEGPIAQLKRRGAGTAIVDQEVVDDIRAGRVQVIPAVTDLALDGARLADDTRVAVDAIVVATGYRTGLDRLVGHLDVLDERGVPRDPTGGEVLLGLRFVGFVYRPGLTGYVGGLARRAAREIARDRVQVPA